MLDDHEPLNEGYLDIREEGKLSTDEIISNGY